MPAIRTEVLEIAAPESPSDALTAVQRRWQTPHPVFWVIAIALVVIAVEVALKADAPGMPAAFGQATSSAGLRGVFAFSGQLSKTSYGIFMVDVDAMTIWIYEYLPQKSCLRLAAARTWRYDRYLEDYNGCGPPPDVIEQMIEEQRRYKLQASEGEVP
jgi:hypothetical protein